MRRRPMPRRWRPAPRRAVLALAAILPAAATAGMAEDEMRTFQATHLEAGGFRLVSNGGALELACPRTVAAPLIAVPPVRAEAPHWAELYFGAGVAAAGDTAGRPAIIIERARLSARDVLGLGRRI